MEQTLVLVKPDGVQRGLVGEIIPRLERRGLKLNGLKLMQMKMCIRDRQCPRQPRRRSSRIWSGPFS